MNLQLKADFSQKCFDIFSKNDDLLVIINEIENVMNEYGLSYTTENMTEQITTAEGKTYFETARDRFEAALDIDIPNVQHMKALLSEHINFLNSFLQPEELVRMEIASLKDKRAANIKRKFADKCRSNVALYNSISDDYTRRINALEAQLEPVYA